MHTLHDTQEDEIGQFSPQPTNKGFSQVHQRFMHYGWELTHNTDTELAYTSPQSVYDEFLIKVEQDHITVSMPVPNSNVSYRTNLPNYFAASEFIQTHLEEFQSKQAEPKTLPTSREFNDD